MVYVYKKNQQINNWYERNYPKKIRTMWGFEPQNTMFSMIISHLRSYHWANREIEKYRLNAIDEIGKRVLYWNEVLKINAVYNPPVIIHITFVHKTYLYKAPITTNRYLVTGGFGKKTPKIWVSFAQKLVYGHFQQPIYESQTCS